jgi:tetratricopeptide (TPR) repeat protein
VAGYAANGHGEFGEVHELRKIPADGAHAAYSLQTTAGDYARFWAALLQGKGLKPSSWQAMLTPQRSLPAEWGRYDSLSTQLSWGLGVGLQQSKEGLAIWHWGNNGDFRCYALGYPDRKQGLVYFTNSANGLRISQALVGQLLGGDQPALAWIGEENYQSPGVNFRWEVFRFGAEVAFQRLKEAASEVIFEERMINGFGYQLMQLKRWDDARAIFAYNLAQYPKSANAYDSYAELLLRRGELAAAANNYRRSLELNPRNPAAVQLMQSLAKSQAESGTHTFVLPGFPEAKFITLVGDFNDWNDLHTCFIRKGDQWVCSVDWEAGEYLYKFVVDGEWMLDPTHSDTRTDAAAHINSVIQVEK